MTYQGANGKRPWKPRWDSIVDHIPDAPEGGRALDLGAAEGRFSTALAAKGYHVEAYEKRRRQFSPHPRVNFHKRKVRAADLHDLDPFDVGLALSILHHMDDWPDVLATLSTSCALLFVETPGVEESRRRGWDRELAEAVRDAGEIVARHPGHKTKLQRPTVLIRHAT